MHVICVVCLVLAATSMAADNVVPVGADETHAVDIDLTTDKTEFESIRPVDDSARSQPNDAVTDIEAHDEAVSSAATESSQETTNTPLVGDVGENNPRLDPEVDGLPFEAEDAPITLDELLRQIRETPQLQREALLTRLAERHRLAIALRTTLEAAQQVAAFGEAGTELLKDGSLDEVVATMIEAEEQAARNAQKSTESPSSTLRTEARPASDEPSHEQDDNNGSAFDAWRPVYIVRDARGQRIGWVHLTHEARAVTYVGEAWHIGDETVTVIAVASDQRGRYLVVEVNGVRHEIHLF